MRKMLTLLCFIILFGCAPDSKELDQRSTILGLAIDQGAEKLFSISIQLPILTESGGEGSSSPQGGNFETFTTEADSMWEGLSKLEAMTPSVLFFGHLKAILISESVAKTHLKKIFDSLEREAAIGNQIFLLIVEDQAGEFMKKESPLVSLPSLYLDRFFQADQKLSRTSDVKLFEYRRDSNMISETASLPIAKLNNEQILIEGMAIIKDDKLVSKLDPSEVGFSELLKKNKLDFMNYDVVLENDVTVTYSRIRLKQVVDYKQTNPVQISLNISGTGEIVEVNDVDQKVDASFIKEADEAVGQKMEEDLKDIIAKMQEINAEPWLFGHRIWALSPKYYETLDWERSGWSNAKVDISVEFKTSNTGEKGAMNKKKIGR